MKESGFKENGFGRLCLELTAFGRSLCGLVMTRVGQGQFQHLLIVSETWTAEQVLLTTFELLLWRWMDWVPSAQGGSVQTALFLRKLLVCFGVQPGLSCGWRELSQTSGPEACASLCLSGRMGCRRQLASVWDEHQSDVHEPGKAEPLGRSL